MGFGTSTRALEVKARRGVYVGYYYTLTTRESGGREVPTPHKLPARAVRPDAGRMRAYEYSVYSVRVRGAETPKTRRTLLGESSGR